MGDIDEGKSLSGMGHNRKGCVLYQEKRRNQQCDASWGQYRGQRAQQV